MPLFQPWKDHNAFGPREISRELIRAAKMWASGCTIGGGIEQCRADAADEEPHDLDRRR